MAYDVYGIPANSYREACIIAGCDGPDHDYDEEMACYQYEDIKAELGGLSFDKWREAEAKRAWLPQPAQNFSY